MIAKIPIAECPIAKVPIAKCPIAVIPIAASPIAKCPIAERPIAECLIAQVQGRQIWEYRPGSTTHIFVSSYDSLRPAYL